MEERDRDIVKMNQDLALVNEMFKWVLCVFVVFCGILEFWCVFSVVSICLSILLDLWGLIVAWSTILLDFDLLVWLWCLVWRYRRVHCVFFCHHLLLSLFYPFNPFSSHFLGIWLHWSRNRENQSNKSVSFWCVFVFVTAWILVKSLCWCYICMLWWYLLIYILNTIWLTQEYYSVCFMSPIFHQVSSF